MATETQVSDRSGEDDTPQRGPTGASRVLAPRILPAVCAATVVGTVVATARYGIGLTPDSVVYFDGAHALAHGHGYTANLHAISDFPPGYSAVLSLAERAGQNNLLDAARVLSVGAFVAVVVLGYVLLRRHVHSGAVVACATVVIGCSAVLLEVYEKALSEHLFLVVVLLFALAAEKLMTRPRDPVLLGATVVLIWAAFYIRYIGIVLVLVGALLLLIAEWRQRRSTAVVRALLMGLAGASVPMLWVVRNRAAGVPAFGHRSDASASPFKNIVRVANELSTWLATDRAPSALRALVFVVFVLACAALAMALVGKGVSPPPGRRSMLVLIVLVVVYVGYLVASASVVAFAAINTRLLAPVFVPVVVIAAWLYEYARAHVERAAVQRAITAAGIAWVVMNVGWFAVVAAQSAQRGAGGYATKRYHDSQILRDAEHLDFSVPTFSNDASAIALFTGRPVRPRVARTFFQSDQQTGRLADFVHLVQCKGAVQLVWFLPNPRSYLYTPEQLSKQLQLRPRVRRPDGVIYDVRPRGPAVGKCA